MPARPPKRTLPTAENAP